jgi:hypothetical protein
MHNLIFTFLFVFVYLCTQYPIMVDVCLAVYELYTGNIAEVLPT